MPTFNPDLDIDGSGTTNGDRAARLEHAIREAYRLPASDTLELCNASDLLCDLLHLCNREGWDIEEMIASGRGCWEEESELGKPGQSGRRLDFQSERSPVWWSHFDCWNDTGSADDDEANWAWNDPRSVACVKTLAAEWFPDLGEPINALRDQYLTLGFDAFFAAAAQLFLAAGFDVYLSDTMFEVYANTPAHNHPPTVPDDAP